MAKLLSCGQAPRGHFECVYARRLTSPGSCSTIRTKHLSLATSLRPKLAASPYCLSLRKLWSVPSGSVACLMHNKNRCFACCAAEERVPKHDLWLICCQSSLDSLSIVFHWPAASLPGCLTALLPGCGFKPVSYLCCFVSFYGVLWFRITISCTKGTLPIFEHCRLICWSTASLLYTSIRLYWTRGAPINFEQRIKLVTIVQLSWH